MRHAFLPLLLVLTQACASGSLFDLPAPESGRDAQEARRLLARAVEARGGDPLDRHRDLAVRYEGRWGRLAPLLQPVLADRPHRSSSEERLLLDDSVDAQAHRGPAGTKTVFRGPDRIAVRYSDRPTRPEDEAAAALVADAYRMFLLGTAWVDRRAAALSAPGPERLDGRPYARVDALLRPGLGAAPEDRVRLWLDAESGRLHRLLFTLQGFPSTVGAEVDVTIEEWRELDGLWWPVAFRERIRAPVRAFAHFWRMTGFDADRDLEPGDLDPEGWSERALRPAEQLPVVASPGG